MALCTWRMLISDMQTLTAGDVGCSKACELELAPATFLFDERALKFEFASKSAVDAAWARKSFVERLAPDVYVMLLEFIRP